MDKPKTKLEALEHLLLSLLVSDGCRPALLELYAQEVQRPLLDRIQRLDVSLHNAEVFAADKEHSMNAARAELLECRKELYAACDKNTELAEVARQAHVALSQKNEEYKALELKFKGAMADLDGISRARKEDFSVAPVDDLINQ